MHQGHGRGQGAGRAAGGRLASLKARAKSGDAEAQAKVARRDAGRRKTHEAGNRATVVATADAYAQTVVNHLKAAHFDDITSLAGCADYLTWLAWAKHPIAPTMAIAAGNTGPLCREIRAKVFILLRYLYRVTLPQNMVG